MGTDYYRYILDYLKEHPFTIDYGVEVKRITPVDGVWCVETNTGSDAYRAVIIATGRFGNPIFRRFPAKYRVACCTRNFHTPEGFERQRVLAVGSGPSGVDIAVALAGRADVYLSVRSDILLARKYPYGLPNTAWQGAAQPDPGAVAQPLDRIVYQSYPDIAKLGLKFARNREDRIGTSAPRVRV